METKRQYGGDEFRIQLFENHKLGLLYVNIQSLHKKFNARVVHGLPWDEILEER